VPEKITRDSVAEAIRDLHARYTDAVWRKDFSAFGQCFTPSAQWRIGGLDLRGRPQIEAAIEKILGNFRRVLITFQAPIVHVADDDVTARTYIQEQVARVDGTMNICIGRYYERFMFDEGRWRFSWRLFQRHYSGPPDFSGEFHEWDDYGAPPGMPPDDAPSGDYAAARWNLKG
jgi:uncharacterized protein (TIGR02246 family)